MLEDVRVASRYVRGEFGYIADLCMLETWTIGELISREVATHQAVLPFNARAPRLRDASPRGSRCILILQPSHHLVVALRGSTELKERKINRDQHIYRNHHLPYATHVSRKL